MSKSLLSFLFLISAFSVVAAADKPKNALQIRCSNGVVEDDWRLFGYDVTNPNKTTLPAKFVLEPSNLEEVKNKKTSGPLLYDGSVYAKANFGEVGVGGNSPYQCQFNFLKKELLKAECQSGLVKGEDTLSVESYAGTITVKIVNRNADLQEQSRSVSRFATANCNYQLINF
jgi:hypothetical protein